MAPSTEPLLVALLERILIAAHLSAILDHPASGLATLINDSRLSDLRLLYTLFGRVEGGHAALQAGTSKWIVETGAKINAGLEVVIEKSLGDETGAGTKAQPDAEGDLPMDAKSKPAPKESASAARTRAALGWVQHVIDLKDKFDTILDKAFSADKAFEKSINDVSYPSLIELTLSLTLWPYPVGLHKLCES